jgi:hypothetical protein
MLPHLIPMRRWNVAIPGRDRIKRGGSRSCRAGIAGAVTGFRLRLFLEKHDLTIPGFTHRANPMQETIEPIRWRETGTLPKTSASVEA